MKLTADNYFSQEAQMEYMSASQFKEFDKCEAAALAEIKGEYVREKTTALMVGSYVGAYFSDEMEQFRIENPDIFKRNGTLKSEYVQADEIIQRIERDDMFRRYMSGKHQVIMTGDICGVPVKIKMDSYHPGRAIVDLKIMRDFQDVWVDGRGKLTFVEAFGYDIQGAMYRAIEGNNLPFIIAAATKERVPDIAIISIPDDVLDASMDYISSKIRRFADIKSGTIEPERCGRCDYCKETKKLDCIIDYRDLTERW